MSVARGGAAPALLLIVAVALAARLLALPGSTEATMEPDGPHLLNVARCFERGQGFSNPAAWPAWMTPERLPHPETFKEPGYPFAVSALARSEAGLFGAALLISVLAGLLLPPATFLLARHLGLGRLEATLAGLFAAASPLLIQMSVRITVDALFPALLTLAFVVATWRPARGRPAWADLVTGVLAGLAFMVRGLTIGAVPALVAALVIARPPRRAGLGVALAAIAAAVAAAPFLLRNLRLFGVPFHSDVSAYALWPYLDHLTFSHGLERPPAPLPWALGHPVEVLRHVVSSVVRFGVFTLPQDLLGSPLWVPPLAAGAALALSRRGALLPLWLHVLPMLALIFAVNWDARYFVGMMPFLAVLAGLGAGWFVSALGPRPLLGPIRGAHLLLAALALTFAVQAESARRDVARIDAPETRAAIAEARFLREHLAPDEAVMVVTTSTWSWFADRPSVHWVIADEDRFAEVVRRLKVRYAVLPTSRIPELAARHPGGRLPRQLVVDHVDSGLDATVFRVGETPQSVVGEPGR